MMKHKLVNHSLVDNNVAQPLELNDKEEDDIYKVVGISPKGNYFAVAIN